MRNKADVARNLCFHMLTEVFKNTAYSNIVLQNSLRSTRLTQQEKSFTVAMFYGTITRVHTLNYYLRRNLRKKFETLDLDVHTILLLGLWQLMYAHSVPPFAAVNEMVKVAKLYTNEGGVRLVNAVLRTLAKECEDGSIDPENSRFDVKYSLNKELSGCLIKWYGQEKAEKIAAAFLKDPSVTARVNRLRVTKAALAESFKGDGVTTEDGLFMEEALRIDLSGHAVYELSGFKDGLFMIQDEGAMLASFILSPEKGQKILDVCSAPGGKSCHIAELMEDQGKVTALDLNEIRLNMVAQNQERLGLTCIDTAVADATKLTEELPQYLSYFDGVLTDVPCSGLGLLLRKPDIRLTMTYEKMQELIPVQAQILNQAAGFVKPGGTLVYSTCTINPHENGEQADNFLLTQTDFEEYPFADILPAKIVSLNPEHLETAMHGRLQLLPDVDGCDGFYIARFRRKP
ncbi:MAG: 16S rRNA (cytosine(967)-C(5))-methyltransferase RsmB [Eubacteriales bacterium]